MSIGRSTGAMCGAVLLAACADLPRDPNGTLERVRAERSFRIGVIDGASQPAGGRVVARVARDTGATATVARGQLEPLLVALEKGRLDLVIGGRFDANSPWSHRVTLGKPLHGGEHVVARNGENAWIMLVERVLRAEGAR